MITLGQQSQLGIGIAISLQNNFSGPAAQVTQQLARMKNQANSAVLGAMRDYRNYAAGIAGGAAVATMGMYKMTQAGAEFQHQINKIAIVGGRDLNMTRKQLTDFSVEMSKMYTQSPLEVANALFENVKAGITNNLKEITRYQLATATAVDERLDGPGGVAEKLLGIMNAMDISSSKFGNIANSITAVANATISNVSDIGEAMQYAAFTAKSFNIPLEMTLALVGKLSQAKIVGSSAGTGIYNMLLQLSKTLGPFASKKAVAAWGMLGLNMNNMRAYANNGHIDQVIMALSQATSGMSPIKRNDILSTLFNRRGDRAIEGMFDSKNGNVSIASLVAAARAAEQNNTVVGMSKAMMNDLSGDFKHFRNSLLNFKNAFTEAVGPLFRVIVGIGTKLMEWGTAILKTPVGKILAGVTAVTIPLIGVLFAFRAAALTATIALNGFTGTAASSGFSNLMGSGLNMLGGNMMKGKGIRLNANGRAIVTAGEEINYMGKIYKGGQFLPKGFQAAGWGSKIGNFFGASSAASGMGWGAKLAGFAGKAAPWLGELVSFGAKWLPVIGWIWAVWDILHNWFGLFKDRDKDPVREKYEQEMFNATQRKLFPERQRGIPFDSWVAHNGGRDHILEQTINIVTPDGKQIWSKQIQHEFDKKVDSQFNLNTLH